MHVFKVIKFLGLSFIYTTLHFACIKQEDTDIESAWRALEGGVAQCKAHAFQYKIPGNSTFLSSPLIISGPFIINWCPNYQTPGCDYPKFHPQYITIHAQLLHIRKTPDATDSAVDLYTISIIILTNVAEEPLAYTVTYFLHTSVLSYDWWVVLFSRWPRESREMSWTKALLRMKRRPS